MAGTSDIHTTGTQAAIGASDTAFGTFLDRLMRAESNGRNDAKNPLSSALGPFQFIKSTFLDVMRRHFAADVSHLNERDILALRTDHGFARRAAEAFSKENRDFLVDRGLKPTFGDLRLAFLLGPVGAARVLEAPPSKPLHQILEDAVIAANPFMRGMTASGLIARAARDVSPREAPNVPRTVTAEAAPARPEPAPAVVTAPAPSAEPETVTAPAGPARVVAAAPAPSAGPETATAPAEPALVVAAEPAPVAQAESTPAARTESAPAARTDAPARSGPKPSSKRPASVASNGTVRSLGRVAVINVTCNSKVASCRRWIDQQVARLSKIAAVSNRRGA